MAKLKKTKTVLKAQRDGLARFKRYLPTLELKKQQLRMEVSRMEHAIEEKVTAREGLWQTVRQWVRLFAEDLDLGAMTRLVSIEREEENIAGVTIPIFRKAHFERQEVDLFATPAWVDSGLDAVERLISLEAEIHDLKRARNLLSEELRITSQRVNLFEKVKIPETKENIRVIKIALGDAMTAGVVRAKTAKSIIEKKEAAAR